MVDKVKYQIHEASGTLKEYRASLVETETGKRYTIGAQLDLINDKESEPTEHAKYQAYRAECEAKVDAEMLAIKTELEAALEEVT